MLDTRSQSTYVFAIRKYIYAGSPGRAEVTRCAEGACPQLVCCGMQERNRPFTTKGNLLTRRERAGVEKRAHPRYLVRYLAFCWREDQRTTGITLNLSKGGCALQSYIPLLKQTSVRLELFPPGHQEPLEVGTAVVRWVQMNTAGLEFVQMTPKDHDRLLALVDSLARSSPSPGTKPDSRSAMANVVGAVSPRWWIVR